MEPISSFSSSRATASQPPVPAQQKRDEEALTAPQSRSDTYTPSNAPTQDLQLQRRQVVEDISRNQKASDQLRNTGEQLQTARSLADAASSQNLSEESRESLSQQFAEVRDQVNEQAESGSGSGGYRIASGVGSADEASSTRDSIDGALGQIDTQLSSLQQQNLTLGSDFPRTSQKNNIEPPVSSPRDAAQVANQLQRQLQTQPDTALSGQANISRQTALTLFQ